MRYAKLDRWDIRIMLALYFQGCRYQEARPKGLSNEETQQRLYRLSGLGLAACDLPGAHEYTFRIWSLSPEGERAVELSDEDYWGEKGYRFSLRRLEVTGEG